MVKSSVDRQPRFIAIEGPLRVGKTSLADLLADRLHAVRIRDVEDNPFLEGFYKEEPGASFRAQLYFLIERYKRVGALSTRRRRWNIRSRYASQPGPEASSHYGWGIWRPPSD